MAGNSPPRRSSRARTVQTQSQQSSAASSLSGRPERATRSLNKAASPQKSTPSLSDEPPEESVASTDEIPTRRRRTRAQEHEQERERAASNHTTIEMTGDHDDIQEDDEAVRCICGFDEYPGPPPADEDKKPVAKDSIDVDSNLTPDLNDDVAGFFVQCDICKIWQHGACVGIMSEEASPDEYFCEDCRKDLHRIHMASNGQRYSHYLPLVQDRRTSTTRSRSPKGSDNKDARETRSGRQSSLTQTSKRRSTMNSRDAAYDEEEQLRRAIEASKEETIHETTEGGHRRTKRGRSDSEEKPEALKRQRTSSKSPSPLEQDNELDAGPEDTEEANNSRNGVKRSRSGLTRTQSNQKEKSEREERERQRAEAAKKRNGRAERRRADGSAPAATILVKGLDTQADTDSDPSEELPLAVRAAAHRTISDKAVTTTTTIVETKIELAPTSAPEQPPPSSQPTPDTPPAAAPAAPAAKPRRTKKKGRNQYTKDREAREETSPARSQSRDVQGHEGGGTTHHHGKAEGSSKSHSRTKGGFNSKVSMTDMRRKAHAMLDYITRTQVEMAGEVTPPNDESRRPSEVVTSAGAELVGASSTAEKAPSPLTVTATSSTTIINGISIGSTDAPKDFKELTSMEMMDRLTRDLVKWQKEFAS